MAKKTKQNASKEALASKVMMLAQGENLHQITIRATFKNGAGGIFFFGENIVQNQKITTDGGLDFFTVNQASGNQMITVAGSAPSGGSISIEVREGTKVLSPASDNVFTRPTFSGFIFYTIN